ncbi:MAG TPA: DUF4190 domain-containing protein [Polyangia bacterium]|nr:DUF4190 domain-containing protein [Polyangia bacterium]
MSAADELEKLARLKEQGVLSDAEFQQQKQAVLARSQPRSLGDNAGMRALLPVGRSGLAIAAGYVGLVGLFLFPAAPVAIVLGVLSIRDIRNNPRKHGMGRAIFAIVAGSLVTLGAIVLLAAAALG